MFHPLKLFCLATVVATSVFATSAYTGIIACDPDVTRLDDLGYANYDPRFNGRDPRDPDKPMPVKLSMQSVQTFHGIVGFFGAR